MSRAFTKEDSDNWGDPGKRFFLPPKDDPGFDAAAAEAGLGVNATGPGQPGLKRKGYRAAFVLGLVGRDVSPGGMLEIHLGPSRSRWAGRRFGRGW